MSSLILQPIHTSGDGNCFYYSFLQSYFERPINKEEVLYFKQKLSNELTLEKVLNHIKNELLIRIFEIVQHNKELEILVETDFEKSIENSTIKTIVQTIITNFKTHLLKDGDWAEDWAQQYCAKELKCNILVYLDSCNKFNPIFEINKNWPSIILYNRSNLHWETAVFIFKAEGQPDKFIWKFNEDFMSKLILKH